MIDPFVNISSMYYTTENLSKCTSHIIMRRLIKNYSFICVENTNNAVTEISIRFLCIPKNGIWKAVYMVSIFWCWYHFTGVKKENTTLCTFEKRKNKNNCLYCLWRDKRSRFKIKTVCSIAEAWERERENRFASLQKKKRGKKSNPIELLIHREGKRKRTNCNPI